MVLGQPTLSITPSRRLSATPETSPVITGSRAAPEARRLAESRVGVFQSMVAIGTLGMRSDSAFPNSGLRRTVCLIVLGPGANNAVAVIVSPTGKRRKLCHERTSKICEFIVDTGRNGGGHLTGDIPVPLQLA